METGDGGDVGIPPGTEYDLPQLKGVEKAGGREKHPIKVAVDQLKARKTRRRVTRSIDWLKRSNRHR